jgi:hypothetical protein
MSIRSLIVTALVLTTAGVVSQAATRTARSLYVFDINAGYSTAFGNYSGIGSFNNWGGTLTASETFDPTYHFGFTLGRIHNDRLFLGLGFRYTKINIDDHIGDLLQDGNGAPVDTALLRFHQYDFSVDCNYYPVNIVEESMAPYFGGGLIAGLTSWAPPGFASESKLSVALAVNFGLDLKVWSAADKRSFVTLSSVNSWQVVASGDRPRYLNFGGAVRYFFRP